MDKKITNRFDKSFGPVGSQAGIVLFIVGIALSFAHLAFILLILFGAFVAFTHSSATIYPKEKKVLFATNLFGLFKLGKWITLGSDMQVKLLRNNNASRAYSRGNRSIVVKTHPYKVSLFSQSLKEISPLKYFDDLPKGKQFVEEMDVLLSS